LDREEEVRHMAVVRWNPFGFLPSRIGWQGALRWPDPNDAFGTPFTQWWPSMDIYSKDDDLVIKAEVPGALPQDIDVDLDDDVLTISGKRAHEEEVEEDDYYRKECAFGSFCRTIPLPKGVKEEDISAKLKDGVLEVVVKGAGTSVPTKKKIPVEKGD
jgi:HSP20 family protein